MHTLNGGNGAGGGGGEELQGGGGNVPGLGVQFEDGHDYHSLEGTGAQQPPSYLDHSPPEFYPTPAPPVSANGPGTPNTHAMHHASSYNKHYVRGKFDKLNIQDFFWC